MMWHKKNIFPFSAIVGQKEMTTALILNAIAPSIGGLLIKGEKGTAKSTAVRALAAVLPEIDVVDGCPFNCDPHSRDKLCPDCQTKAAMGISLPVVKQKTRMVMLPLGATEDRVVGTIDMTQAVRNGKRCFEPGILASAHRGILYIDEVNLLDDHLVDIILDSAAMGMNVVEREGISFRHSSEFILIGTMNPEEGELRPQFLDRFGMCIHIEGMCDPMQRIQVMKRKERFDCNSEIFIRKYQSRQDNLSQKILQARNQFKHISVPDDIIMLCSELSSEACVAGHRADIIMMKAARAIASYRKSSTVNEDDVRKASELVLFHRRRNASPPQQQQKERVQSHHDNSTGNKEVKQNREDPDGKVNKPARNDHKEVENEAKFDSHPASNNEETTFLVGEPFPVSQINHGKDKILRKGSGKRTVTRTPSKTGKYVTSTMYRETNDLAFDATLRAAAPYQNIRKKIDVAIAIHKQDIREKQREKKIGNFIVFVVDASGSMGAGKRMIETKGAILSLLMNAYQKRDKVSMVAFKGDHAEVLLPPTGSVELAHKLLGELPTGGRTPLAEGLFSGYQLIQNHLRKDPHVIPLLILISDGKANVSQGGRNPVAEAMAMAQEIESDSRIHSVIVDVERPGLISFGLARQLSSHMGADYFKIEDLKADRLLDFLKADMLL